MQMSSEIMMVSFFIILLSSYLPVHCSLKLSRSLKNAVGKQEVPSKHGWRKVLEKSDGTSNFKFKTVVEALKPKTTSSSNQWSLKTIELFVLFSFIHSFFIIREILYTNLFKNNRSYGYRSQIVEPVTLITQFLFIQMMTITTDFIMSCLQYCSLYSYLHFKLLPSLFILFGLSHKNRSARSHASPRNDVGWPSWRHPCFNVI